MQISSFVINNLLLFNSAYFCTCFILYAMHVKFYLTSLLSIFSCRFSNIFDATAQIEYEKADWTIAQQLWCCFKDPFLPRRCMSEWRRQCGSGYDRFLPAFFIHTVIRYSKVPFMESSGSTCQKTPSEFTEKTKSRGRRYAVRKESTKKGYTLIR